MKKRTHWTTTELCTLFARNGKPLKRQRISELASLRGVNSIGRTGKNSEAMWPPDAHLTLKPAPKAGQPCKK